MTKAKKRKSSWGVTLGVGALAVAYVMFFYLPTKAEIESLRAALKEKRDYITMTETLLPLIAQTEKDLAVAREAAERWSKRAPLESRMTPVYEGISDRVKRAGAITTRFDPSEPVAMDSICRVPIALGTSGTFSQHFNLIASLEQMPQTVWLEELHFEAPRENGLATACEAKLIIFVNKSEKSN